MLVLKAILVLKALKALRVLQDFKDLQEFQVPKVLLEQLGFQVLKALKVQ